MEEDDDEDDGSGERGTPSIPCPRACSGWLRHASCSMAACRRPVGAGRAGSEESGSGEGEDDGDDESGSDDSEEEEDEGEDEEDDDGDGSEASGGKGARGKRRGKGGAGGGGGGSAEGVKKAAAAMTVGVGSFSDPECMQARQQRRPGQQQRSPSVVLSRSSMPVQAVRAEQSSVGAKLPAWRAGPVALPRAHALHGQRQVPQ